ncbi:MAG TPA: type II toxin-antitoxin system PemK/MazF family toxin [Solirubrobacteraceae bacterium]
MRRGEVWWHEPPDDKRRPVLILTRAEAIDSLNKLVVAPATGTVRGLPSEVPVGPDDGMPRDSVISLDNTTLVRKALLTKRITTLGSERMDKVCRAPTYTTVLLGLSMRPRGFEPLTFGSVEGQ